jgi:hypothetical protein
MRPQWTYALLALTAFFTSASCLGAVSSFSTGTGQPLAFLSDLRSENTRSLSDVQNAVEKLQMDDHPGVSPSETERLEFLTKREKNLRSRQIFLNRLILQFDLKFKGGDVQSFLKTALHEMAEVDGSPFLTQLEASVSALPPGQVDVLKFVEGYMKRCSFENPMRADEYLSSLDYYNGVQAQKAHGMSPVEAAE